MIILLCLLANDQMKFGNIPATYCMNAGSLSLFDKGKTNDKGETIVEGNRRPIVTPEAIKRCVDSLVMNKPRITSSSIWSCKCRN